MLKIIINCLVLCISSTGFAETLDCGRILAPDHERLDAALNTILQIDQKLPLDTRQGQLDEDIRAWINAEMVKLSPGRRESFLQVLERARPVSSVRVDSVDTNDLTSAGEVVLKPEGLDFRVDAIKASTELFRLVLVHEVAHALRFVAEGPPAASSARGEALVRRRAGIYREEMYAHREVYRYLRRNYTTADVERLREILATEADVLGAAVAEGFVTITDGQLNIRLEDIHSEAGYHLFFKILQIDTTKLLLRQLEPALTSTEAKFIKDHARRYDDRQHKKTRSILWEKHKTWLVGGSLVVTPAVLFGLRWLW